MVDIDRGSLFGLVQFTPVYFNYEDHQDLKCALVVHHFDLIGSRPVTKKYDGLPPVALPPIMLPPPMKKEKKAHASTTEAISDIEFDGSICSMYGVSFVQCVSKCIPVDSRDLENIAQECNFVTCPVKEIDPSRKRNLLYSWYATNVYSIRGKGCTAKFPFCLEVAIRTER
jgi:hypothetical protein